MAVSELVEKQWDFASAVAELIQEANRRGFEVSFGHAYRCDDCAVGSGRSLHKMRLAVDLNLWKNGIYLTKTEDYEELGLWWEEAKGGAWGGRFKDGNHFSFAWRGRR